MMNISVIASGSNGNCCLVEHKNTSVLVDAGKSAKEITRRMDILNKNIEDVDAVLITHRHTDHTRGVDVLSRRFGIPVYISRETDKDYLSFSKTKIFDVNKRFRIGELNIKPILTSHSVPCCGFSFNKEFGILTDTGYATKQMKDSMKKFKLVLLESNHDIDMLVNGRYPYFLKQWILSDTGHLSNVHACELIQKYGKNLNQAVLGHLSANNNTPESALKTFETLIKKKIEVKIASRDKETGVFDL